jgi:predicted O-methyltransferase YrrM
MGSSPYPFTMNFNKYRTFLAMSRFARFFAFPGRAKSVFRFNLKLLTTSARWLLKSREYTNYTYHLSPRNLKHLAHWVAAVTDTSPLDCEKYILEVLMDEDLNHQVLEATLHSKRAGTADREIRIGRRAGWYAIIRAVKPLHVVETGTDKGLGSIVIAAALLRNGSGKLTTIDINPSSGYLANMGKYPSVCNFEIGDSLAILAGITSPIDIFIHDSDHSPAHEAGEYAMVENLLSERAIVISDNAHATDELLNWSARRNWYFAFFAENPLNHWYPGAGIGAAWRNRNTDQILESRLP